jgi:hypothetical protein
VWTPVLLVRFKQNHCPGRQGGNGKSIVSHLSKGNIMSKVWSLERLKKAKLGVRVATYEAIPANAHEAEMKESHPELFKFEAISIGDDSGQAFLVPLDESSKETAELIIEAIAAYQGGG